MTQYSLSLREPGYISEDRDLTHIYEGIARIGERNMEEISFSLKPRIDREKLGEYQTALTSVFSDLIEKEGMTAQIPTTTQIRGNENWLEHILKGYGQMPALLARTETYGVSMTLDLERRSLRLVVKTYQKDKRTVRKSRVINGIPIEHETIMQAYEVGKEKLKI